MANTIPCPNPVCTHAFSMAELQSAAQLLCPKCGFKMQGKGKGPAPPAPAAPSRRKAEPTLPPMMVVPPANSPQGQPAPAKVVMASPVSAPPPLAAPIAAAPPAAPPVTPDGGFFSPGMAPAGPLLRSSKPTKKGFNWKKLLIVLFILGFAASVVILGIGFIFFVMMGGGEGFHNAVTLDGKEYKYNIRNLKKAQEPAFKLVLNSDDWAIDNEVASRLDATAAWKAKDKDFWFAVVVKDYGMVKPRDAEMMRHGIDKLEKHFGDALELAAKAEPTKIGNLPAQKLSFKGLIKAASWIGDCTMFFKDGIGYWLYMASPDPNVLDQYAAELPQKNFFVVTERRGWREQPPPTETFASSSGKLTLTAPKGVWEKHDAKNEDERGDLLLFGTYQREKDNRKNASLLVVTLDRQPNLQDAMKSAREYLNKTRASGENTSTKIVPASDAAEGKGGAIAGPVVDVGNRRGIINDLKLQFNDEPQRYFLLAVINEPDLAYAIRCECTWTSRQIWRQEFLEMLRTLKVRKGE